MLHVISLLCVVTVAACLVAAKNAATSLGKGLTKEIQAVKQPIDEAIAYVGSSQCSNVKKLIGVTYEQIEGEKEPDLETLKIELRTNDFRAVYNISKAAEAIPRAREVHLQEKLIIFIHGFTDDPTKGSFQTISESFLKQGKCNILALDGSSLIHWLYLRSTTYVRFMGEKLGAVLAAMMENGVDAADIHLIGHSLGSHISGFTGKTVTALTGKRVGRISGLDPAGPCFSHIDEELRLKSSDAAYVDVIHTDAGVYGLKDAVGHSDYYPNSGSKQPNCLLQTCSHSRAWELYAESLLRPKAFAARKCDDWDSYKAGNCTAEISYMGYPSKANTRGKFFLRTGDESPYGLGEKGLKYEGEEGVINKAVGGGQSAAKGIRNIGGKILG